MRSRSSGGITDPGVGDGDRQLVGLALGPDLDAAAVRGELHGVGQQVEQHLLEAELVRLDGRPRRRRSRRRARCRAGPRVRAPGTGCTRAPARRGTCVGSRTIWPASTLDRSRISFSSSSRCLPEFQMSWTYSSWRSLSSPNSRSSRTSEKPMTALSGVRSSWDMLARNSDLCRLATSSSADLVSSSRNSRAFTSGDRGLRGERLRAARPCPRGTNRPSVGGSRPRPTMRSPRSMGIASTDRQPSW